MERVTAPPKRRFSPLLELAGLFARLGSTAFGGPAAHIAMMEDEVVRRRGWLRREEFLDLLGATNLIPGPNSTEMAIHLGHRRAGWPGMLVAGTCFILPALAITWALAWAYVCFGRFPEAGGLLYGVKPVIIAVVAQALWGLWGSALKSRVLVAVALASALASAAGAGELPILFGAGAILASRNLGRAVGAGVLLFPPAAAFGLGAALATPFSFATLFLVFLKVGTVLFGSGYVLLAFLRTEFVLGLGWLTEGQLLDAIAVGQVTPGPVFTTATFVGYVLGGDPGALVATVGIFLPAFFFVAVSGPLVPRLRSSPTAGAFLDGVNAASFAVMAVVTVQLAANAVIDWPTLILALGSGVLLIRCRVNSSWLVLGGAVAGLAMRAPSLPL